MIDETALQVAQKRLREAYDPQRFRAAAEQWAALLASHLDQVEQRQTRVLNWAEPDVNIADAERWLDGVSAERSATNGQASSRFADIVRQMLERGHNLHHPHYIGHQVPAPV